MRVELVHSKDLTSVLCFAMKQAVWGDDEGQAMAIRWCQVDDKNGSPLGTE